MGERATQFAKAFFEGAEVVRLERDDPKEIRGHFGRLLAYVFVKKSGRWTSYNVEAVRAGMSPYFTKYGYSHRFHNQFTHAESEARQAKRRRPRLRRLRRTEGLVERTGRFHSRV
ncbi:MAG: thermonuclease family protein [Deltaproteobacteria bacterium]|nr:thermonuclease family protein [Deltaproteobacteria bacterium]